MTQHTIDAAKVRELQLANRLAKLKQNKAGNNAPRIVAVPAVPGVLLPGNLLTADMIQNGMDVVVPVWPRQTDEDTLRVFLGSTLVFEILFDFNNPHPGTSYTLTVGPNFLTVDGTHRLYYEIEYNSGSKELSEELEIRIDRRPPLDGNVPPTLVYPAEVVANGITLEYLAANNNEVIATVPSYAGMEAGQVVHPRWDTTHLTPILVTAAHVTAGSIPVPIPGDTIVASGEGVHSAIYYLTSRTGFDGKDSNNAEVNVYLTQVPTNLQAPVVPLAADGVIDLADANLGVVIDIDPYDNAIAGDSIIPFWGPYQLPQQVVTPNVAIAVAVPRGVVIREGSGTQIVRYTVVRGARNFDSPVTPVSVNVDTVGPVDPDPETPENGALVPLTVTGNGSTTPNQLQPSDLGQGAFVTVPFYAQANVGEIIRIYWGQAPASVQLAATHTIEQTEIDASAFEPIDIPVSVVDGTPNDPAWPVYYTLSHPASVTPENPVLAPVRLVQVRLAAPGGPGGLQKATFDDASARDWLLLDQVVDGARATVNVYQEMKLRDVVTVAWEAFSSTNAAAGTEVPGTQYTITLPEVTAVELANGVKFSIPYAYIEPIIAASSNLQGSGKLIYTVTQDGADYTAVESVVKFDLIDVSLI